MLILPNNCVSKHKVISFASDDIASELANADAETKLHL